MTPTVLQGFPAPLDHVMLVDFAVDNREAYAWCLGHMGYRVTQAGQARDAFRKLDECRPDLLITELMLPDLDGLEFCRQVRKHPATDDLPILALTALPTTDRRVIGLRDVARSWVVGEPCLPLTLLERVRSTLRDSERLRKVARLNQQRTQELRDRSTRLLERAAVINDEAREVLNSSAAAITQYVRDELGAAPGLATSPQAISREWGVSLDVAEAMLTRLRNEGLLTLDPEGTYISLRPGKEPPR